MFSSVRYPGKGQATVIYCRIPNWENRQYEHKDILFQSRHDTNSICCSNIHWKKIYDTIFFIPSSPNNTVHNLPNFWFLCIISIKFIFFNLFPWVCFDDRFMWTFARFPLAWLSLERWYQTNLNTGWGPFSRAADKQWQKSFPCI